MPKVSSTVWPLGEVAPSALRPLGRKLVSLHVGGEGCVRSIQVPRPCRRIKVTVNLLDCSQALQPPALALGLVASGSGLCIQLEWLPLASFDNLPTSFSFLTSGWFMPMAFCVLGYPVGLLHPTLRAVWNFISGHGKPLLSFFTLGWSKSQHFACKCCCIAHNLPWLQSPSHSPTARTWGIPCGRKRRWSFPRGQVRTEWGQP